MTTQAPGKLYIAGEYAVVETGQPALIAGVSQYLYATTTTSDSACGSVHSTQNADFLLRWTRQEGRLVVIDKMNPYHFITEAIQIAEAYARSMGQWQAELFDLTITSELDDPKTQTKFGLGSSGAVVVATIQATLDYHRVPYTSLIIYKLSAITLSRLGSNGSYGDLAASAFGGVIAYRRPDAKWLHAQLQTTDIATLIATDWPSLDITPLTLPSTLHFLAGWTRTKADTGDLVKAVQDSVSDEARAHFYRDFLEISAHIVTTLIEACQQDDAATFLAGIRANRALLKEFSHHMGITIETPTLSALCDIATHHHASAKTSGAGGGDCGICFAQTSEQEAAIQADWRDAGIQPLDLTIAPTKGL